ncbi:precorrin-6y C5,15-methyltransferase (decarboxylating) subunit CbiE [Thermosynechococcus sp. HN-54]|uniref:precorrin-6y C5,15-methyltransferase (decarboxylating) subunit CbiE n=1 Tax=Thermosynechococcus sp. HN-54 TaxID=2933959 RepID=UPI00202CD65C|nr:precorrin-6y C5,15-methyltransferase (decarboxylating) subunit CbiE [Thermosynechococcus sp. HN-54]URR35835.1 precorrin-6y C5,15-methyltransferase (decarboxylating) subunit CbiE [Thermosynechococcus sp. HN-54]
MTPIHVVGIGLEGLAGLGATVQEIIHSATLLVGSDRHLQLIPQGGTPRLSLRDFNASFKAIQKHLETTPNPQVVILTSGDPLFYGLGRWLLEVFAPEQLTFHPHLSAVQLAFSRLKLPWQDAVICSAHGRDLAGLVPLLQRGVEKIAIYTDSEANIAAISRLYQALQLPVSYQAWVCQALGSEDEAILPWDLAQPVTTLPPVHPLNLVVLLRQPQRLPPREQPVLGLGDDQFFTFGDRPSLMTKREVRVLALAELALTSTVETVWDVGAGTGSVAVEIARLAPQATVYAIEKTAIGFQLIQRNREVFGVTNLIPIQGEAPQILSGLPQPDRVFIGGSGAQLLANLEYCWSHLRPHGRIVLAIATLEHQGQVLQWCQTHQISPHLLHVQISRSVPLGQGHRLHPLNPVTLITLTQG